MGPQCGGVEHLESDISSLKVENHSIRVVAMTSCGYTSMTALMLESLRTWHPDAGEVPVVVYAMDKEWSERDSQVLAPFGVDIKTIDEIDDRYRRTTPAAMATFQKLEVMLDQDRPFLFLDSDMLMLRPLDRLIEAVERVGWFAVHEGTRLGQYYEGDIVEVLGLGEVPDFASFNTGVLGCDPAQHRDLLELAYEYSEKVSFTRLGDQGLLNIAWYKLRGEEPPNGDREFNGGWESPGALQLANRVAHFAGSHCWNFDDKSRAMRKVWDAWPKDVAFENLTETSWWRDSLPHPWPWLTGVDQPRYRAAVKEMRQKSQSLLGVGGLLVSDAYEAFLLDPSVLREQEAFWRSHRERFAGIPLVPTYHLTADGGVRSPSGRSLRRARQACRSLLPV